MYISTTTTTTTCIYHITIELLGKYKTIESKMIYGYSPIRGNTP